MEGSAINILQIDFSKHENAMVSRFGATPELCTTGFSHLKAIIGDAQRHAPGRYYALPYAADQAMHVLLLDNLFVHKVSEKLFGHGSLMAHDPFPPEGPARETAWNNTRTALANVGIGEMPTYANAIVAANEGIGGPFAPEGCWFWIERLAA